MHGRSVFVLGMAVMLSAPLATAQAQDDEDRSRFRPPPPVESPEVLDDRSVTFRIWAESAETVRLAGGDIPNLGREGAEMTQGEDGVWQVTVGPLEPGAYRYHFDVDGIRVLDPVNTDISESNTNVWSLVVVPGSERFDQKNVPHGAVSEVHYFSETLNRPRRMHVYTPPGYEKSEGTYPVFYLLHGAFDSDDAWTTVGRAGFILDNLIAAGKAEPMIVVMPDGHTGRFRFGQRGDLDRQVNQFVDDFIHEVRPYIESHYRTKDGRQNRAIAGLSMGGAQTLNVSIRQLDDYGFIGVFSSGIFGINDQDENSGPSFEEQHQETLDNPELKKGLELFWFATGKDDFLIETSRNTVDMLQSHGFEVEFLETAGGHTWLNWRDYLSEFAPLLFNEDQ